MHGTRQDVKTRLCLEIVAGDDSARTVSCPTTPGRQASLAYAQHIKPRWTAPSKLGHCVTSCAPYSGNGLSEKDVTRPLACRSLTSMAASIMSVCLRNPARVEIPWSIIIDGTRVVQACSPPKIPPWTPCSRWKCSRHPLERPSRPPSPQ